MSRNLLACLLVCSLLTVTANAQAPSAESDAKPQTIKIFDKLTLTIPADWKTSKARSRIIEHEFSTTEEGDETAPARITMMAAGGDIDANIERWKGQFTGGKEAKVEKMTVAGETVHLVELNGSFKETMGGGPFSGGKTVTREDYGMLGAIIELQDNRKYFIKLTGPAETIAAQRESFKEMLKKME
ncbi:hypothetical protein SH139x_001241 [Planctomycetaceae bacterium SH139]